jgi:hypothetical protein
MISPITPTFPTVARHAGRTRQGLAQSPKLATAPAQRPDHSGNATRDSAPYWSFYA